MTESLNDILDKLRSGAYTPNTLVERPDRVTVAYAVASYLYYDAGLPPETALPKLQISDPGTCHAIAKAYAVIAQKWDRVAAREKRFGADRDVNH